MLPPITTTKPGNKYRSLQRPRVYRALRRRGYTKQEAARISNAQAPGHTVKAPNYSARAGQTIAGNLARGNDGKFASGSGGSSAAPAKGAAKPKKPKQPKKTPEQRRTEQDAERQAKRDAGRSATLDALGGKVQEDELYTLYDFSDGKTDVEANLMTDLAGKGLVEQAQDGSYRMTPQGRELVNAADRGDTRAAQDALSKGQDLKRGRDEQGAARQQRLQERQSRAQERDKKRQEREAARLAKQQEPKKGGGGGGGGGDKKPEKPVSSLADALARMRANAELLTGQRKSFTVFKDATGQWRWVGLSSNAYRDRDREIVSTKALADDCLRADTDGMYGPLRWWHMKGVDIGDCDFNAMSGRFLVEMGTFRNKAIAQAVEAAAPELELSIGFHHPANEPDAAGVFHMIRRFERSLVPLGRASNPFTRLTVKETPTMVEEKVKEAIAKLGSNPEARAYMEAMLADAKSTQKGLDEAGTAFKSDDEVVRAVIREEIATALKAFLLPKKATDEEAAAAVAEETPPVDAAEVEDKAEAPPVEAEGEMDYGPSFTPEEMAEIAQAIAPVVAQAVLAELAPVLDLETKMRGYADEVKGLFTSQQRAKDDTDAQRQQQLTALQQQIAQQQTTLKDTQSKLAELMGEQPRAAGYRASSDPLTVIPEGDARLKELTPQPGPFADIYNNLFGQATPAP